MAYSIVIAGTTDNTASCAEALFADSRFEILGVITPVPKPVGRKKEILKNPLHLFAEEKNLPSALVSGKIDDAFIESLTPEITEEKPDFFLVVDFGYIIPKKLLEWPEIAPLNVHPSALPKWRGSSPGQFTLLFGDSESAVTLMVMDEGLDSGPVIAQYQFKIEAGWNQDDYYQHSFSLINNHLADDIAQFATGKITAKPQQEVSPTPVARRLSKEDAFIDWDTLKAAMKGISAENYQSKLLAQASSFHNSTAKLVVQAARAFEPWPQLWTQIPTTRGLLRMKILTARAENEYLHLEKVHIEGQVPSAWNQVKNLVQESA